jgi:hypothetical protein
MIQPPSSRLLQAQHGSQRLSCPTKKVAVWQKKSAANWKKKI